jgi:hypothetical protein
LQCKPIHGYEFSAKQLVVDYICRIEWEKAFATAYQLQYYNGTSPPADLVVDVGEVIRSRAGYGDGSGSGGGGTSGEEWVTIYSTTEGEGGVDVQRIFPKATAKSPKSRYFRLVMTEKGMIGQVVVVHALTVCACACACAARGAKATFPLTFRHHSARDHA